MRTCLIIGAGLAGLVAARRLQEAGWKVVLLDKGHHPGGRLATRSVAGQPCDHGAQFMTVRDPRFAALVAAGEAAGVLRQWCAGFPILTAAGVQVPDGHPRWCAPGGFRTWALHLAQGLDIRTRVTVTRLVPQATGWQLHLTPGDTVRGTASGPEEQMTADAVICTLPGPQAVSLLQASGVWVPDTVTRMAYQPCHALLLAWTTAHEAVLPLPGGLRCEDPSLPLGWMASQRAKGLVSSGEILVVHAAPGWSSKAGDVDAALLLPPLREAARQAVLRAGGRWPGSPDTEVLHRWKYSLPVRCCPEPMVRLPGDAPLLLAGDGYGDRPRVEGAALSGWAAAEALLA